MPCLPSAPPPPIEACSGLIQDSVEKGWIPADNSTATSLAAHSPTAVVKPAASFTIADIDREAADFERITGHASPLASSSDQLQYAMAVYEAEMSALKARHDAALQALQQQLRRAHAHAVAALEREHAGQERDALQQLALQHELERTALRSRLTDEPQLVRSRADAIAAGERAEQQLRGWAAVFAYDRDVDHRYLVCGDADENEVDAIRVVADADVREADVIVISDDEDVFEDELTINDEEDSEEDEEDEDEDDKLARRKAFIEELRTENEQSAPIAYSRMCRVCYAVAPRRRAAFTACGHIVCRACAELLALYADKNADEEEADDAVDALAPDADEEADDDYADAREDVVEADGDAAHASDGDDRVVPNPIGYLSPSQAVLTEFAAAYGLPQAVDMGYLFAQDDDADELNASHASHADDAPHADYQEAEYTNIRNYLIEDNEDEEEDQADQADDADADDAPRLSCPLCRTVGGFVPLFEEEAEECC